MAPKAKAKAAKRSRKTAAEFDTSDAETIFGDGTSKLFGVGGAERVCSKSSLHKFFQDSAELATPSTALPSIDASPFDEVGHAYGGGDDVECQIVSERPCGSCVAECVPAPNGATPPASDGDRCEESRGDARSTTPRDADLAAITPAQLCEAVVTGDILDVAKKIVGDALTEQNVERFTDVLTRVAKMRPSRNKPSQVEGANDDHGGELSKHEARRLELLEKILAEQTFPGKSSMGNLFREKLKADSVQRAKYEALDTAAEQLAFRLSWCQAEAAALTARRARSKTTTWARRDTARFRYRPFGSMVVEWGGWGCADAVKGATAAASKCVAMGHPWSKLHPQSGLMEYAIVEQGWEEEYAVCWQETQDELLGAVQTGASGDNATKNGVDGAVDAEDAERAEDSKAPASSDVADEDAMPPPSTSRAKTKAANPKPSTPKKAKREAADEADMTLASLFKDASRVRAMFVQATTSAEELSSMIRSGGDYKWAINNVAGDIKLAALMSDLRGSVSEFAQHFIVSDVKTVKASYTTARLEHELRVFIAMSDKIASVNRTVKQILNATAAMQSE